jgi:phosphohistidine phosphatase
MKTLTLIRHAKSSWKHTDLTDFQRPLNKRGKNDAPIMGKILARKVPKPDLFLSSPATRALKTAEMITKRMGISKKEIVTDERLYHANANDFFTILSDMTNKHSNIFLCSHNPGITEFVNFLVPTHIEKVPTCGVVHIELPIEDWKEITFGTGTLVFFDCPKLVKK